MALTSGVYLIRSLLPGEPSLDTVVGDPVQRNPVITRPESFVPIKWVVEKIRSPENIYSIMKDQRRAMEIEGKLFAQETFTPEPPGNAIWRITLRENHGENVYTITKNGDDVVGWQVPCDTPELNKQLIVGPIPSTKSLPPQFPQEALFKIIPDDD